MESGAFCTVVFCVIGVLGLFLANAAPRAAEWYVSGGLQQDVEYDTNINLATASENEVSDVGFTSSVLANAGGRTPNLNVRLDTKFNFTVFPKESELNSNDQYVVLGTDYRTGRSLWGIEGEFIRDTTRTSDVDATGRFLLENKRRVLYRLGPSWSYQLSPLDTLDVSASYTNVHYPSGDLRDYGQISGTLGYTRFLTPRAQFLTSLSAFHYDSNSSGSLESNLVGLLIGGSYAFSERVRGAVVAGPRVVNQKFRSKEQCTVGISPCPPGFSARSSSDDTSVGYNADATLSFQASERTFLEGQYTRTAEPNTSTGALLERNEIRLYGSHKVLEKVAIDLTTRYFMQDTLATGGGTRTRHYASIQPGVRWRLLEDLSLNCFYRFRGQKYDNGGGSGTSNAAFARLTYNLPTLSTSR